jgi:hypothetical protein
MPLPGAPPPPPGLGQQPGPGGTAPATPMQPDGAGKLSKAKVTGGLGLLMLRTAAISAAVAGREGQEFAATLDKHIAGLSKILSEPDRDIGMAELNYMKSQLAGGGGGPSPAPGPKPAGMPPTPPPPPGMPMGAPAPGAEMAA